MMRQHSLRNATGETIDSFAFWERSSTLVCMAVTDIIVATTGSSQKESQRSLYRLYVSHIQRPIRTVNAVGILREGRNAMQLTGTFPQPRPIMNGFPTTTDISRRYISGEDPAAVTLCRGRIVENGSPLFRSFVFQVGSAHAGSILCHSKMDLRFCWRQMLLIDVKKKRNEQTEQPELLTRSSHEPQTQIHTVTGGRH
jgi:hypothetical protein